MGPRIFVSDVQESVHFVRYKPIENQLVIFADETYQRSVGYGLVKCNNVQVAAFPSCFNCLVLHVVCDEGSYLHFQVHDLLLHTRLQHGCCS